MSIKYAVRYLQNGPDSDGFDPYVDYMFDLIFNKRYEAIEWIRSYVDARFDENDFDVSVISPEGIRKEAHIIKCVYDEKKSPDSINREILDSYIGFSHKGGD